MRLILLFLISFIAFGASAVQCNINFNEKDFIDSLALKPLEAKVIKDDGVTKRQYKFRKELSIEEAFNEDSEKNYEPQFYIDIYEFSCPNRVKIWFHEDNNNTTNLSNKKLAARAFKYLTGVNESIFENKMRKFTNIQSFESFDNKTESRFLKVGDVYSVDVFLK